MEASPSLLKANFRSSGLGQHGQPSRISRIELRRLLLKGKPDFPERALTALLAQFGEDQDKDIDFDRFVDNIYDTVKKRDGVAEKSAPVDVSSARPLNVLIICDPGPDPDDCKVLLVAAYLQRQGVLTLSGIICNGGHQARERAKLGKAVLRAAGVPDVRVGVGSAGVPRDPQPHEYLIEGYDRVLDDDLEDGAALFLDVLRRAASKSLCVHVQAGMTDVARVMQDEKDLFLAKVSIVSVQAGLKAMETPSSSPSVALHSHGWATDSSQNNVYDLEAAQYLFGFCFDNGLEMRVVSRLAVPGIPMALADRFAESAPVLKYLANCQRCGLVGLWQKVCAGVEVPPHCTKEWFFGNFCGVDANEYAEKFAPKFSQGSPEDCDIAQHLNGTVNPYDLVAFMSLLPTYTQAFSFERAATSIKGVNHYLFLQKEHASPMSAITDLLTVVFTDISKLGEVQSRM